MSYTVKRGDTMSSIAAHYHLSLAKLESANKQIHNFNSIYVGEHINIPGQTAAKPPAKKSTPAKTATTTYVVKRGDTLGHIASTHHTTVSAIMKANPSIHNANVISVGQHIKLPGSSTSSTSGTSHSSGSSSAAAKAYNIAKSYLGYNISYLKYHGTLAKYLDKWPGNNVCCANFVSACLEKAGLIKHSEHNDTVRYLAANLRNDKHFSQVSLKSAKVGDVVCFHVPGEGDYAHTEIFAGWKNGKPQFIGSNNINSDGTQRISQGYAGYSINAIFHYHG